MKVMHGINMDKYSVSYQLVTDNCLVLTTHNLNAPNCNHRINQERYILPDDGYMPSETCGRNDDGPIVF
jgi:hypothetical protein